MSNRKGSQSHKMSHKPDEFIQSEEKKKKLSLKYTGDEQQMRKKNPYTHRMIHWKWNKKKMLNHNNLRCSHFIRSRCVRGPRMHIICSMWVRVVRQKKKKKKTITRRLYAVDMWYSCDLLALYGARVSRVKPEIECAGTKRKTPPIRNVFTLFATRVKMWTLP